MRINESPSNIVALSDIRSERQGASSPFGPVNPASTTLRAQEIFRANQEARLTELLNSLESAVETLQYKSFTAYDTLVIAMEGVRVALSQNINEVGTDE